MKAETCHGSEVCMLTMNRSSSARLVFSHGRPLLILPQIPQQLAEWVPGLLLVSLPVSLPQALATWQRGAEEETEVCPSSFNS